jgi:hypothetical protein
MYSAREDYSGVADWTADVIRAAVRKRPLPHLDPDRRLWLAYLMNVKVYVRMGFPLERLDIDTVRGLMAMEEGERKAKGGMIECPNCGGLSTSALRCDNCDAKMGKGK